MNICIWGCFTAYIVVLEGAVWKRRGRVLWYQQGYCWWLGRAPAFWHQRGWRHSFPHHFGNQSWLVLSRAMIAFLENYFLFVLFCIQLWTVILLNQWSHVLIDMTHLKNKPNIHIWHVYYSWLTSVTISNIRWMLRTWNDPTGGGQGVKRQPSTGDQLQAFVIFAMLVVKIMIGKIWPLSQNDRLCEMFVCIWF